ncbi:hypothetical protein [Cupriavidus plantarum]|uniref:hypothetical protein n=1 Tax=Cupriavidus plantarum TaxID=942865 RepID=UPI001B24D4DE|nr:hypothetical protein [Cupriavidus plantarum]CAG2146150.1 hypothetical protein LMG26296_03892 [Cupriavidus plantarum]SMR86133.1 hypothetical protein SAMN05421735_4956 [Cupriavidus plantarum]
MNILLGFSPFLAFAIVEHLLGILAGLTAGAVMALALVVRDAATGRSVKVLEIGTVILFGALALYAWREQPAWSIAQVRMVVDAGLLGVVLASMAIGMPFTMQYARERVPPSLWRHPTFVRINYVITGVWALAFLALIGADVLMRTRPGAGALLTVAALCAAVRFTQHYPRHVAASAAAPRQ